MKNAVMTKGNTAYSIDREATTDGSAKFRSEWLLGNPKIYKLPSDTVTNDQMCSY